MGFPTSAEVSAALNQTDTAPIVPPVAAPAETTPVVDETAKGAATEVQPQPVAPETTPSAATTPVELFAATIKEKGARAAFDALPEEVKDQIAAEMYPGLHRRMSQKEVARKQSEAALKTVQTNIEKVVNERFDELMTTGMGEDEKKAYFDKKAAGKPVQPMQPTPEEEAVYEEATRKLEYAWELIENAGLPRDPNDARVRSLDFGWDEPDYGKAMARLKSSLKKASAAPATSAPVTKPASAPVEKDFSQAVKEAAAEQVREELRRLGLLSADTGRPGAGGSPQPPKTMKEARAATEALLRAG